MINSLSKLLEKEHNFAILHKILKIRIFGLLEQHERTALHKHLEQERNMLQRKAFWIGMEMYAKYASLPSMEFAYNKKVFDLS
jgi:hypothetical protein